MRFSKRVQIAVVTAGVAALALAGCSGESNPPADSGELTPVSVGYIPLSLFGALYVGVDQGIFEEHGLDVELVPQGDIGTIVSGLVSGQYDFGMTGVSNVIDARANNIPLQLVAPIDGITSPHEGATQGTAIAASPASGITSMSEVGGKRVAVVGLNSLSTVVFSELADRAGVDVDTIEFVQLPFPQMPTELLAGTVDVAMLNEPFIAPALAGGAVTISKPNNELLVGVSLIGFSATEQFIGEHEDTVQAFHDAMIESIGFAWDNQELAVESIANAMDLSEEAAAQVKVSPNYEFPEFNTLGLEAIQELMVKFNGLKDPRPVDEYFWSGAVTD